jgi:predicted DNA-binding WGR domain protein
MAGFQIRRRFSHHTGGTKAYQVWEIQHNNAVVVVFQYGSFTSGRDAVLMGGTIDVQDATTQTTAEAGAIKKVREKKKRGYQEWDTEVCPLKSYDDFCDVLRTAFGSGKASTIVAKLDSANFGVTSDPAPEVDPENSIKGKAKPPAPKSEESLPEWGTW